MAEPALYGNNEDPEFPYEIIAKQITWIPEYIDQLTPKRRRDFKHMELYDTLLNVLLVFSRARTSALLHLYPFEPASYKIVKGLISRLNGLLLDAKGQIHRLQIFRYDRQKWFIVNQFSPLFIWKRPLTVRETGLTLISLLPVMCMTRQRHR